MTTEITIPHGLTEDQILILRFVWEYTKDTRSWKKFDDIYWNFAQTTMNGFVTDDLIYMTEKLYDILDSLQTSVDLTSIMENFRAFLHYLYNLDSWND